MILTLQIVGGLIWGTALGFGWYELLYIQSKRAFEKSIAFASSPLRVLIAAAALFAPVFLGVPTLLSSFGGFALGFGLWWAWYSRGRGGKNG